MPKTLDFNSYRRPELVLVMKDDAQTVIHVTTPTLQLVEELKANLPELQRALTAGDAESSKMLYTLAARLINCNLDGLTVTGPELAKKYRLNLKDMTDFYEVYLEFIEEIKAAKN